ncbi:hypothetical protein HDF17_003240 [Granulicella arctica]|uniref:Uncharacterized protein n=1 Tax=Granulicella arctica TaxID=940613 RepID=A0A7Y9TIE3_9BACT|nr:hypothetical protein [Granulicella arctica]
MRGQGLMSEIELKRSEDCTEISLREKDSTRDTHAAQQTNLTTTMQSHSALSTTDEWTRTSHTTRPAVAIVSPHDRIFELECENFRLRKLVVELLVKNQHLRDGSRTEHETNHHPRVIARTALSNR